MMLLPGKGLLPKELLPASNSLLVRFHPLGPAFLVALAGVELLPCSSTPLALTLALTATRLDGCQVADHPDHRLPRVL